jgi:polyphosphate kinase 2 (PPK2 family)
MLTDEGVTILKFFLAIDKDTQRQRFQDRVEDPAKSWKFKPGDVAERKFWDDYQAAFEDMLTDSGVTILKFFLAIDKDTQRQRFQERVDDPTKRWKFSSADLPERQLWDDYTAAFEEMLTETSTAFAPWYLVPSNHNWLRNLVVSEIVAGAMDALNPQYPEPAAGIEGLKIV